MNWDMGGTGPMKLEVGVAGRVDLGVDGVEPWTEVTRLDIPVAAVSAVGSSDIPLDKVDCVGLVVIGEVADSLVAGLSIATREDVET